MSFDRNRLDFFRDHDGRAEYSMQGGAGVDVDPYDCFREMRSRGELLHTDLHRELGIDSTISTVIAAGGMAGIDPSRIHSAVSFEAVNSILKSDDFDNSAHLRAFAPLFGRTLLSIDGDEHRRKRGIVAKAFSRSALDRWLVSAVEPAVAAAVVRLDSFSSTKQVDLIDSFVSGIPADVVVAILGVQDDDIAVLTSVAMAMVTFTNPDVARMAGALMDDWISELVDESRDRAPDNTLISMLAHAELDGDQLTTAEASSFLRLLFVGGFETTLKSMSNMLVGVLTSDSWARLSKDRTLIPQTVEEALRWQSPVLGVPRVATTEIEVCGVLIPAQDVILCFLASANRDERRWKEGERFDIDRPRLPHLSFGVGPHVCIGMQLARLELARALDALLTYAPGLELADIEAARIRGLASRGPTRLPVLLGR